MNKKEPFAGFTILELVIAIAVILILAAAALQGSGGIIASMRFNNAFNKILFMTQQARSRAISGKNTEVKSYEIKFTTASAPYKAEFITNMTAVNVNETVNFESSSKLKLEANADGAACNSSAEMVFENATAKISLLCDMGETENLKISLTEEGTIRTKSFAIDASSGGVPQVE